MDNSNDNLEGKRLIVIVMKIYFYYLFCIISLRNIAQLWKCAELSWRQFSSSFRGSEGSNLVCLVCFVRFFGGLVLDVKRKAPHFLSDFTDALSLQCLASFLFLYCACMSPVITFGGLLGEATEGRIVRSHQHHPLDLIWFITL